MNKLTRQLYEQELERLQVELVKMQYWVKASGFRLIVVFEGRDAAGKGGAIRRITSALDARAYQTISVAAPTEEERAQPYLWRFWRHIPRHGYFAIFDRSWYGRVLVERVEGLCSEYDWTRGYHEINEFEEQMAESGTIVLKFWLSITAEEQLKRFRERETVACKRHKITPEDWRNRKKWNDYEAAVADMVDRTSTTAAPWTLVEANNKYHARIKVLKTLVTAIEAGLKRVDGKRD